MGRRVRRSWRRRWAPELLIGPLVALALVQTWFTPIPVADPVSDPGAVPAPLGIEQLQVPGTPAALRVSARPDPADVSSALQGALSADALGTRVALRVAALDGTIAYASGPGQVLPASVQKIVLGAAALQGLGPGQRFATEVVRDGDRLTLVGGGDPYLVARPKKRVGPAEADLTTLARQVAAQVGSDPVRLAYDVSRYAGPPQHADWARYRGQGVVAPIAALRLWGDLSADPARRAAGAFAAALRRAGVNVKGAPQPGRASGTRVGQVVGPSVATIVGELLLVSDNVAAEMLLRELGRASQGAGTFAAGIRAVSDALTALGLAAEEFGQVDGSGLSRHNRLDPDLVIEVLAAAASREELRPLLADLPMAGFSGSLTDRFERAGPAIRGMVRAKTGSLLGVMGLAGMVVTRDDVPMLFVVVADAINPDDAEAARVALERIPLALAACRCG